jgi:hypothetical protein
MNTRSYFAQSLACFLIWCLAIAPLSSARVEPSHGWNLFSAQEEVQAGKQASDSVSRQLPVLPDSSPVTKYVQRLGADLAAHAPGEKWPYTFHVVNQKEINAFALPGGPVYVNLGTIQAADNEAQLAGVMAHEISHVVQRHGTRAASKQMAAQLPLAILGGVMGKGALSQMAQLGLSFGVGSYFLKNSRKAESEADLLGTDIMYDTGYNPQAMADFFEKLEKEGGARGPQFLSDHPNPGNRRQAVTREVSTLSRKRYRGESSEFSRVKSEVGGMHPLTAEEIAKQQKQPETGALSNSQVTPSQSTKTLDHAQFRINYPDNWRVFGDQNSAVTIAPSNGVSQDAVAYGVMISGYQPEGQPSLDEATHQLVASLRQSNPDMKTIGQDDDIRVNGVSGKSVDLVGTSPIKGEGNKPVSERDWLVSFQRKDGSLLYLVFIAPDQDFPNLRPTYEELLKSLRLK